MQKKSKSNQVGDPPQRTADRPSCPPSPPSAYPIAVVCRDFGICRATIYNLMKRGELKGVKVGGKRIFPASEIQRLLGEGK
jgi:excisionase family DNA binding protein